MSSVAPPPAQPAQPAAASSASPPAAPPAQPAAASSASPPPEAPPPEPPSASAAPTLPESERLPSFDADVLTQSDALTQVRIPPVTSGVATTNASGGSDALGAAAAAYQRLTARLEALRGRLPEAVRKPLERVPTSALLGVVAFGGVAVLGVALGLARSGSDAEVPGEGVQLAVQGAAPSATATPGPASEPAPSPPPNAPATAAAKPDANDEASLLIGLAEGLSKERRDADAVQLVERVLLRAPELRADPRIRGVLLRTAQSEDRNAASSTFALLEGVMAERGAEIYYELWLAPGTRDAVRRRADSWLKSKAFDRVATLPLYTAVKLRTAKTCEDKRALLGLARAGGKETLTYLRELESRTTCAPDDLDNCYPCLRGDAKLSSAIKAIEGRLSG